MLFSHARLFNQSRFAGLSHISYEYCCDIFRGSGLSVVLHEVS
jgi:hypothetical protein